MTRQDRKRLEEAAPRDAPLARSIRAALKRIEDLEVVLQQCWDDLAAAPEADLLLMRRIKTVLEGEAKPNG